MEKFTNKEGKTFLERFNTKTSMWETISEVQLININPAFALESDYYLSIINADGLVKEAFYPTHIIEGYNSFALLYEGFDNTRIYHQDTLGDYFYSVVDEENYMSTDTMIVACVQGIPKKFAIDDNGEVIRATSIQDLEIFNSSENADFFEINEVEEDHIEVFGNKNGETQTHFGSFPVLKKVEVDDGGCAYFCVINTETIMFESHEGGFISIKPEITIETPNGFLKVHEYTDKNNVEMSFITHKTKGEIVTITIPAAKVTLTEDGELLIEK